MPGIIFHYFHDYKDYFPSQGSIDSVSFEKIICYLLNHYTILSIEEYIAKCKKGTLKSNEVCLTFDDGIKSQYIIAEPILRKYNIKAGFFVYTEPWDGTLSALEVHHDFRFSCYGDVLDFYNEFFRLLSRNREIYTPVIEKRIKEFKYEDYKPYCTWHTYEDKLFRFTRSILLKKEEYNYLIEQMMEKKGYNPQKRKDILWMKEKEIIDLESQGHLIGLHSHTHPTSFDNMSFQNIYDEFKINYDMLKSVLTGNPIAVAYPCGNYDSQIEGIMSQIGITVGFKATPGIEKGLLDLPRINHTEVLKTIGGICNGN